MKPSVYGAIYGALVGDAYALGGHWVYDCEEIKANLPSLDTFCDPISEYHPTKKAGDFTHYGDQAMWLLESIALEKEFSIAAFANRWKMYMSEYQGYIDSASKATLDNMRSGKSPLESGSTSQDLSVVGRISPLALLFCDKEEGFEESAILQTKMTHNSESAIKATRFYAQLLYLVLQGYTPKNSLLAMQMESDDAMVQQWIKVALASTEHESVDAINSFGQSCGIKGACPSSLHLILKYEDNYEKAMRENVLAGGDSAARGKVVGMILGAYNGMEKIPQLWIESLSSYGRIKQYLEVSCEK